MAESTSNKAQEQSKPDRSTAFKEQAYQRQLAEAADQAAQDGTAPDPGHVPSPSEWS